MLESVDLLLAAIIRSAVHVEANQAEVWRSFKVVGGRRRGPQKQKLRAVFLRHDGRIGVTLPAASFPTWADKLVQAGIQIRMDKPGKGWERCWLPCPAELGEEARDLMYEIVVSSLSEAP
jgi:hypothetical protein